MTALYLLERLEDMLHTALEIIDAQSKLLAMHGIETDDGELEAKRDRLHEDVTHWS